MELRKEHLGKKYHSALMGTIIEVSQENISILLADRMYDFFTVDIESKPLKKIEPEKVWGPKSGIENGELISEISESIDKKYLLDKLSVEALQDFADRKVKEVKHDFTILGIEFPKNCNKPTLSEIIKTLPNDFVVK
jgi:hypothetical protein